MISKKILKDFFKYFFSTDDFLPNFSKSVDSYPLDLSFTLINEREYYSPKDEFGIPYRVYRSVGVQYNPTRIAAYALANYNRHIFDGDFTARLCFLNCAQWFLKSDSARYEYHFDWNDLKSPWISCMAQGEAASVLLRGYRITGDESYLNKADLALEPLFFLIVNDGVQSYLPDGSLFLEEYPSKNPTHVLNGFLYALIGLGEYIEVTGSERHQVLFDELASSLCKNIKTWCCSRWSLYEDREKANGLNFCTPSYHNLQITQLKWLNKRVNSPDIQRVIESWEKGLNSFFVRIFALVGKVFFRLKNRAQR